MKFFCNAFAVLMAALCTASTASALPLVWRAEWPDAKPVETLMHRGTDIELQPTWYINGQEANPSNWTFTTYCQTNAVGPWFGPLPGAFFSHTNDIGAAFYNVMVRAQMPGGDVNYTAFARLRMLDSPGFTPGELPLPVSTIDFSKVVAVNAPWLLPSATNGFIKVEVDPTVPAWAKSETQPLPPDYANVSDKALSAIQVEVDPVWTADKSNYYTAAQTDDAIDALAAYYITYTAAGAAFPTRAALLSATVVYSGGAARTPTRNDYAVVLADESHGGAEWRYIYTVAAGATSGQWDAQYPIETNDYEALSNLPQINGVQLFGNKTGADLGLATPANVAAAATAATNYTDAATTLSTRGMSDWHIVSNDPDVSVPAPYWGDTTSYPDFPPTTPDDPNGAWIVAAGQFGMSIGSRLYTTTSMSWNYAYASGGGPTIEATVLATREELPGYVLGFQTNQPLASAEMALTNSSDIVALASRLSQVSQSAANYTNAATNALPAWTKSATQPLPPDYANVSNKAYSALQSEVDPIWTAEKASYATVSQLSYSFNTATVGSGTTPTVTGLANRAINTATLGSTVTAATVTLPAAVSGRSRDFFIDLTIEAVDAPTLTFIDPATSTTATVAFGADSLADIAAGYNLVLFTELPNNRWLVSVRHEEASS